MGTCKGNFVQNQDSFHILSFSYLQLIAEVRFHDDIIALPGAVNPVRSQGICGSCYAYSVTGAMEGAYFIKVRRLIMQILTV